MPIIGYTYKRRPHCEVYKWFVPAQFEDIKEYLKRLLYVFLNNNGNEWFSVSDLVGKLNKIWKGTPIQCIYDEYERINNATAYSNAAKDVGWFYWNLLQNEREDYETRYKYKNGKSVREYRKI